MTRIQQRDLTLKAERLRELWRQMNNCSSEEKKNLEEQEEKLFNYFIYLINLEELLDEGERR